MIKYRGVPSVGHSRAGGNPGAIELDSRLRGSDKHIVHFFWKTTEGGDGIKQIYDIGKVKIRLKA
jgi:hypothetical protein